MNYARIARAIEFYKTLGYLYIDVPWVADYTSVVRTAPEGVHLFPLNHKAPDVDSAPFLIASAEQSFLMLAKQGKLLNRVPYMSCTPCFRAETNFDDLHQMYFMKLELFCLTNHMADKMFSDALRFAELEEVRENRRIVLTKRVTGTNTRDLDMNGIEIGSYYDRDEYSCGTGLAEPRFTKAMKYVA